MIECEPSPAKAKLNEPQISEENWMWKNYYTCQTNEAIIDVATGKICIDRPPNMYSEMLFCLCFEKNPQKTPISVDIPNNAANKL